MFLHVFTRRFRMFLLEVWRSWRSYLTLPASSRAGLVVVAPMPSLGSMKLGDSEIEIYELVEKRTYVHN